MLAVLGEDWDAMNAPLMPIDHIPDWERRLARVDACWQGEILDRPVVVMHLPRANPDYPWPAEKKHASVRDRWFDGEYAARRALAGVMNTEYLGDALPGYSPNLGPEVFSAFFGQELEFSEGTSWSIPVLHDWAQADRLKFSEQNLYWQKLRELTEAGLAIGRNKFYTGLTDFHPGGDAVAAFRDPMQFNLDLLEHPDDVKKLLRRVTDTYFRVYDRCYDTLRRAGQAITCWAGIVSTRKWYVPSNDFSCMVSKAMFDEFFLPGIIEECRHMEANVYHLDGPGALRHLDSLLGIPELNSIQWVSGAGHGRSSDWMPVYKQCQAAGKGLQIGIDVSELPFFMENLRPNGIYLGVGGIKSRDDADAVLRAVAKWR